MAFRCPLHVSSFPGNALPEPIYDATVVPYEDSFLLVGNGNGLSDRIYRYENLGDSWTLLETRLQKPVADPVALMVDADIFPPC